MVNLSEMSTEELKVLAERGIMTEIAIKQQKLIRIQNDEQTIIKEKQALEKELELLAEQKRYC